MSQSNQARKTAIAIRMAVQIPSVQLAKGERGPLRSGLERNVRQPSRMPPHDGRAAAEARAWVRVWAIRLRTRGAPQLVPRKGLFARPQGLLSRLMAYLILKAVL